MRADLLSWQWEGYAGFHRDPANLLIHIVAVPAFGAGIAAAVLSLALGSWLGALTGLFGAGGAFAAQAYGHSRERTPPIPFDGPVDALSRIAAEQGLTFYRYVLTGGWWAALRG